MESRTKLLGHPVHQMLVPFPLGLLATGVIFDVIHLFSGNPGLAGVAFWMITSGIIGGLIAAPFGFIDWRAIPPNTRAKSIGLMHGAGNAVVLLLFILSWWLRYDDFTRPGTWAVVLSFSGAGLVLVTAWLGGELVDRLRIGVDDDAGVDAPSSLSPRH